MAEFVPPPGTEFLTVLKCKFYGMTDVIPTAYAGAAKPKLPPLSTLCGTLTLFWSHLTRVCQPSTTQLAPCATVCVVSILTGC